MLKSMRSIAWLTALSIAATPMMGYAQVPELVPVPMDGTPVALPSLGGADNGLSWVEERQLGDRVAYSIQQNPAYERDPLLHDYVNGIWQQLLNASLRNGELGKDLYERMAWKMFLVRDPTVNAFALPGAYIGVNLGLISVVDTRDELASVLAHESVHIFQRHIARLYGESQNFTLLSIASFIVGAIAASANPNIGGAIMMGGQAAAAQNQINFTRTMEYEADRIGYKVLRDAGFRPQGMAEMFQKLEAAARYSDLTSYPYLRTHPLTSVRIAEAQTRTGVDLHNTQRPLDYPQALMAGRAKVLARTQPDALHQLIQTAQGAPANSRLADSRAGDLYAGALAAMKLRQFAQAQELYLQLLEATQAQSSVTAMVRLLGAEIALAADEPAKAWQVLGENPVNISSMKRAERLLWTQTSIALGQPKEAIDLLQSWVFEHHDDDLAWTLLSTAYNQGQQPVLALRAEGEARMAVGDFGGAVDRFKVALGQGKQHNTRIYDLELIQARLKAAEQAQKEMAEALRNR